LQVKDGLPVEVGSEVDFEPDDIEQAETFKAALSHGELISGELTFPSGGVAEGSLLFNGDRFVFRVERIRLPN